MPHHVVEVPERAADRPHGRQCLPGTSQKAKAERHKRDDVGDEIGALDRVILGFGFLDLDRNELVEIALGIGEQLGRPSRHVRAQVVILAVGQQAQADLQALLHILAALRSECVSHALLLGREVGRHVVGPVLADRFDVRGDPAGDIADRLAGTSVGDGAVQRQRVVLHPVVDLEQLRQRNGAILVDRLCVLIDLVHGKEADGADDQRRSSQCGRPSFPDEP